LEIIVIYLEWEVQEKEQLHTFIKRLLCANAFSVNSHNCENVQTMIRNHRLSDLSRSASMTKMRGLVKYVITQVWAAVCQSASAATASARGQVVYG